MTHYELFFFYNAGYKPRQVMRIFGIAESTAYRAYRNYHKAQNRARSLIKAVHSLPFKREKKVNDPDQIGDEIGCLEKREIQIIKAYRQRKQRREDKRWSE